MYYPFARFWANVERRRILEAYADAKAVLFAKGLIYQVSFYGHLALPYDGQHTAARIEIMSDHELTGDELAQLYDDLYFFQPERETTLFAITHTGALTVICR